MKADLKFIGKIKSELTKRSQCPKQGHEGAPDAYLIIDPVYEDALKGIKPGSKLLILTWLDQADRTILQVHPRGNPENPLTGVFFTRSPNRPNPIGIHQVKVVEIEEHLKLLVGPIEVLDNTPVIDIKISFNDR